MKLFSTYLKKEHLEELRKRQEFINHYRIILQLLEQQKNVYFSTLIPLYKLNPQTKYNIDMGTGKIISLEENGPQPTANKKNA